MAFNEQFDSAACMEGPGSASIIHNSAVKPSASAVISVNKQSCDGDLCAAARRRRPGHSSSRIHAHLGSVNRQQSVAAAPAHQQSAPVAVASENNSDSDDDEEALSGSEGSPMTATTASGSSSPAGSTGSSEESCGESAGVTPRLSPQPATEIAPKQESMANTSAEADQIAPEQENMEESTEEKAEKERERVSAAKRGKLDGTETVSNNIGEGPSIPQSVLIVALAEFFRHRAWIGHKLQFKPTPFHSKYPVSVPMPDYLQRLATYFQCSDAALILSLIYVDRIVKSDSDFVANALSIHRLVATSLMMAAKFHDDVFYSNAYYAKVAGMKPEELTKLEKNFVDLIKWKFYVTPEEYDQYHSHILKTVQDRKIALAKLDEKSAATAVSREQPAVHSQSSGEDGAN